MPGPEETASFPLAKDHCDALAEEAIAATSKARDDETRIAMIDCNGGKGV